MLYFDYIKFQKKVEINKKLVEAYKKKDFKEIEQLLIELAELDSTYKSPPFLA